jgi:hypothetical protein
MSCNHRQTVGDRAEDHRTRMNANSHRQLRRLGIGRLGFVERPLDRNRRQQRAPHMVLMRERCPKQRHKPVAGNCGAVPP